MKFKTFIFLFAGLFLVFSIVQGSVDQAKLEKLAEKMQKAWDERDTAALVQLYAEDATMVMPGEAEPIRGRKAIKENQDAFYKAMPDMTVKFPLVLFSGDYIVFEGITQGTNTGPLITPEGEIPATGRTVKIKFAFIAKVNADGLIVEDRTYFDSADFMKQLGLME